MVGFGDGDGRRVEGVCCCKFCGGFGCEGFDAELAGRGFDGIGGSVDDVFGVESARGGSGWMRYSSGLLSGCCCVPDVDVLGVCGGACGCPLDCEGSSVGMLGGTVVAGVVPVEVDAELGCLMSRCGLWRESFAKLCELENASINIYGR